MLPKYKEGFRCQCSGVREKEGTDVTASDSLPKQPQCIWLSLSRVQLKAGCPRPGPGYLDPQFMAA